MVVWSESFGGSPSRYGLVGQRVLNSGELVGAQRTYYEPEPPGLWFFWESLPAISYSPAANQYLLTSRVRYDSRYPDRATKGRLLFPDGEQSGNPFLVSAAGFETTITAVPESTEQLVVSRAYPSNPGIYGQMVDVSDANVGSAHRLDPGPAGETTRADADVAFAKNANVFLATWRCFEPYQSLEGQLLDSNGVPTGAPFNIATNGNGLLRSEIAYDPHLNRFLVAYEVGTQIRGQFIDASGQLQNSSFVLFDHPVANITIDETPFSLAFDPVQNIYLLVSDADGTQDQLVAQLFGANGQQVGAPVQVGSRANTIEAVELASIGNGNFYVSWMSSELFGYQEDVYGAVLSAVPEPTSAQLVALLCGMLAFARVAPFRRRIASV
jgi:hypothetical protein